MSALDAPAFDRLWSEARRAWQRRGPAGDARVRVRRLSRDEVEAIDGLPWPGTYAPLVEDRDLDRPLSRLQGALHEIGEELLAVLERHDGPVSDPRTERHAARAARADLFSSLEEQVDASGHPALRAWLTEARVRPQDEDQVRAALGIVAGLPADEPTDRAVLAARSCAGDSHALDPGTALERLVRRLLQHIEGRPDAQLGAVDVRRLYERFGVEPDPTSSTVLTLGLPGGPTGACERVLAASAGHHAVLSYGLLRDARPRWPPGLEVFVCENPSVVHGAQRSLGGRCAPLVCTAGWPGSAVQLLLSSLRDGGAHLRHHADFDEEGLAMHGHMASAYGARPWRFEAADYRAAVAECPTALPALARAELPPSDLGDAMRQHGVQVVEELLVQELLRDLGRPAIGLPRAS
ncbi:MAG TPA: TIGR02679 family protein [Solirubrobacteraceae bacterium]|nr:TIGR02679 family protein [Solirubrobacteraceae bacterium]